MHWYYHINILSIIYLCIVYSAYAASGAQFLNIIFLLALLGAASFPVFVTIYALL